MLLDPDAPGGIWTHWLVYNLPATARGLAANVPKEPKLPNGARQGRNDFGNLGFGGPCPPPGKPHHYIFHLFALNTALSLEPGATRRELEETIRGHILAQTELVGRLGR
jgi:Raf kinase inhibitor-like YbhB/YbcL family protein